MASYPIPVRLERALMMKTYLTDRCSSLPSSHFNSDVPQPPTSLVTAPLLTESTYVGLQLVDTPGITFRWGAAHQVYQIQLGLGQYKASTALCYIHGRHCFSVFKPCWGPSLG